MAQTKLSNLINPEVMADMISASLPKKIRFTPFAKVDTTLAGQAGDTITVPKYAYIGDAEDVAEGIAAGTTVLTATTTKATVKKAVKAVELTDEAVLSGYGDPVGETTSQLSKSIASKIDADLYAAAITGTLTYTGSTISYDEIVKAVDLFDEEDDAPVAKVMFVNPKQVTTLRLDAQFKDINKYPIQTVMTGVIGEIAGCQVIPSRRVVEDGGVYKCPIIQTAMDSDDSANDAAALTIYMKRGINLETDRDILAKTTVLSADEHYAAVLSNDSKVVVASYTA